jgi:hypothetical protein
MGLLQITPSRSTVIGCGSQKLSAKLGYAGMGKCSSFSFVQPRAKSERESVDVAGLVEGLNKVEITEEEGDETGESNLTQQRGISMIPGKVKEREPEGECQTWTGEQACGVPHFHFRLHG